MSEHVMQIAAKNMRDGLRLYCMDNLDALVRDIAQEDGFVECPLPFDNVAPSGNTTLEHLSRISTDVGLAKELLRLHCEFDDRLYKLFI